MYYSDDIDNNSGISWLLLEIAPWLHIFRAEDAVDFSQLTFDPGQKELIAGARWEICFLFMLHQTRFFSLLIGNIEPNSSVSLPLCDSSGFQAHWTEHYVCLFPYSWPKLKEGLPGIKDPNSLHYSHFKEGCPGILLNFGCVWYKRQMLHDNVTKVTIA